MYMHVYVHMYMYVYIYIQHSRPEHFFNFILIFFLPSVIVPCGAGSNILGLSIGFSELIRAGEIEKMPRIWAAQVLCDVIDDMAIAAIIIAV